KELELEVRSTCHQIIYLNKLIQMLTELKGAYENFEKVAQIRLDAGDGTLLELSLAQAKKEEIDMILRNQINNHSIYENSLNILLRSDMKFELTDSNFVQINFIEPDTSSLENNPFVNYYTNLASMAEQEIRLAKSAFFPDISL